MALPSSLGRVPASDELMCAQALRTWPLGVLAWLSARRRCHTAARGPLQQLQEARAFCCADARACACRICDAEQARCCCLVKPAPDTLTWAGTCQLRGSVATLICLQGSAGSLLCVCTTESGDMYEVLVDPKVCPWTKCSAPCCAHGAAMGGCTCCASAHALALVVRHGCGILQQAEACTWCVQAGKLSAQLLQTAHRGPVSGVTFPKDCSQVFATCGKVCLLPLTPGIQQRLQLPACCHARASSTTWVALHAHVSWQVYSGLHRCMSRPTARMERERSACPALVETLPLCVQYGVRIWMLAMPKELLWVQVANKTCCSCASELGMILEMCVQDGVRIWMLATLKELLRVQVANKTCRCCAFSQASTTPGLLSALLQL